MKLKTRLKSIVIFSLISDILIELGDTYRASAYNKVINHLIKKGNVESFSENFIGKIKRIKKIPDKKFRDFRELEQLLKIQKIANVYGIGNKLLLKMSNSDLSIDKYIKKYKDTFTDGQKLGLKYWKFISVDNDRDMVKKISSKIIKKLMKVKKKLSIKNIIIAGSYRRGKTISIGDIDLILVTKDRVDGYGDMVKDILDGGYIDGKQTKYVGTYVVGDRKLSFLIRIPKTNKMKNKKSKIIYTDPEKVMNDNHIVPKRSKFRYIQVDIRFVLEEEYPFALLYFTGSKQFNIYLRKMAKDKGYSLNEYGIKDMRTKNYLDRKKFKTESDIIKFIGGKFKYTDPTQRNI